MTPNELVELTPATLPDPGPPGSELGRERWIGAGPVPRQWGWDVVLVLLLVTGGVAVAVLAGQVGAGLAAESRRAGRVAAAGAMVAGLAGLALRVGRGWTAVAAFEHGMTYTAGGRTRTVRWSDVAAVTEKRVAVLTAGGDRDGVRHTLAVRCKDGTAHRVEVGGIDGAEQLSELLHAGTLPHLMPRVVAAVAAGRPVAFGRLTLTAGGLSHGGTSLAWERMGNIAIVNGVLLVRRKGDADPWFAGDCGAMPNVQVLLNLIRTRFLDPDPRDARNRAADESRYSVLDCYLPAATAPRMGR